MPALATLSERIEAGATAGSRWAAEDPLRGWPEVQRWEGAPAGGGEPVEILSPTLHAGAKTPEASHEVELEPLADPGDGRPAPRRTARAGPPIARTPTRPGGVQTSRSL